MFFNKIFKKNENCKTLFNSKTILNQSIFIFSRELLNKIQVIVLPSKMIVKLSLGDVQKKCDISSSELIS